MNDDGAVSDEGGDAGLGGDEVVDVGVVELDYNQPISPLLFPTFHIRERKHTQRAISVGDRVVLARHVADLAGLWRGLVASRGLAALVGVEMGEGTVAVTVGGNGLVVDVVVEGAGSAAESQKVDFDGDAGAVGAGGEGHFTSDIALKGCGVAGRSVSAGLIGLDGIGLGISDLRCANWVIVDDRGGA